MPQWLKEFDFLPSTWHKNCCYSQHQVQQLEEKCSLRSITLSPSLEGSTCLKCIQFSSVTRSCPTLCDPMNRSMPGLPVHHQLTEFTQTHIHQVSDAIQPSAPANPKLPIHPLQPPPSWQPQVCSLCNELLSKSVVLQHWLYTDPLEEFL